MKEKKSEQIIFWDYTFEPSEIYDWVKARKIQTLAIQLPEGLKLRSMQLIQTLETELQITVILLADPCYGACDLAAHKLAGLNVDGIIHFGHAKIPNCPQGDIPIFYIELLAKKDPVKILKNVKNLEKIKKEFEAHATIGLLASVQFITYFEGIKSVLEDQGYMVELGAGDERIMYPGQVLGCNFSAARSISKQVNGYLFIGDGIFHPLGISLATNKAVLALDPINRTVQNIDKLKGGILRQRNGAIARAKECKNFGILLSPKPGQARKRSALTIRKKMHKHGYTCSLICIDNITPGLLDYLPFDGYINTACPRLTLDDYLQFKKVLITPIELEIVLGERSWGQYKFDEIF